MVLKYGPPAAKLNNADNIIPAMVPLSWSKKSLAETVAPTLTARSAHAVPRGPQIVLPGAGLR